MDTRIRFLFLVIVVHISQVSFRKSKAYETKVDQHKSQLSGFTLLFFIPTYLFQNNRNIFFALLSPSILLLVKSIPFSMETVELKVEMVGIHEKRLRKCISKLRGIEKVEVDGNSEKVVVTGYANRNKILKAVRRAGLKADFWSAQNELLNAYAATSAFQIFRFSNFNF